MHPCQQCQYDLGATPVADGIKRCPECGSDNPSVLATAEGRGCGRVFFSMLVILGHAVTAIGVMRFSESLHEHGQRAEWAGFGLGLLIQQAVATLAIFMIKRSDASKIAEPFSVDVDLFWDCLLPSVGLAVVGWVLFFIISIPVALNSL